MDITFKVIGNVIVDHKFEIVDLKATGSNVSCNQELDLPLFHAVDSFQPFSLGEVSHQVLGGISGECKTFGNLDAPCLRITEKKAVFRVFLAQKL